MKKIRTKSLTPANRQISDPVVTSVRRTWSLTHVKSFVASGVAATGPAVCSGAIHRPFLKLWVCD